MAKFRGHRGASCVLDCAHVTQRLEAERMLSNFEHIWEAETTAAERHRLISSLFEQVWQDDGQIVAVKPHPSFVRNFQTLAKSPKNGAGFCDGWSLLLLRGPCLACSIGWELQRRGADRRFAVRARRIMHATARFQPLRTFVEREPQLAPRLLNGQAGAVRGSIAQALLDVIAETHSLEQTAAL